MSLVFCRNVKKQLLVGHIRYPERRHSLASHAPNTSNLGSGRDQYTSQRALAQMQRELEKERERGGGGGRGSEREKGMEGRGR